MLKIHHRVNNIESLKLVPKEHGVEIDIHAYKDILTLHHDPFIEGTSFEEWLKFYDHRFLILNIKEEGIEEKVLESINKHNIKDFFMLDLSFPALMKLIKKGENRIATRVSDYEATSSALLLKNKVQWIWIDLFNKKFPISKNKCKLLRDSGFKLCLVSPELHPDNDENISIMVREFINKNNIIIDAVCTKNVKIWQ
jgi:hypothetical protein